jgi:hypothetical protein
MIAGSICWGVLKTVGISSMILMPAHAYAHCPKDQAAMKTLDGQSCQKEVENLGSSWRKARRSPYCQNVKARATGDPGGKTADYKSDLKSLKMCTP